MAIYITIIATSLSIFSESFFKPTNHFRVFSLSLKSLKDLAILCYGKPERLSNESLLDFSVHILHALQFVLMKDRVV